MNRFIKYRLTEVGRITQRSTGRQNQGVFFSAGKLLTKERYHYTRNSFFAFAACELKCYRSWGAGVKP